MSTVNRATVTPPVPRWSDAMAPVMLYRIESPVSVLVTM